MKKDNNRILLDVSIYTYIDELEERRKECEEFFSWGCDDWFWNEFIERIEDLANENIPIRNADPISMVDNFLINGNYGEFDCYKEDSETDDEFIHRVQDEAIAINPEERLVIFNFYSI